VAEFWGFDQNIIHDKYRAAVKGFDTGWRVVVRGPVMP
jgi:hypothetical protein